jgi:hypothetical protein
MSGFLLFMDQAADGSDGSEVWVFVHVVFMSGNILFKLYSFWIISVLYR